MLYVYKTQDEPQNVLKDMFARAVGNSSFLLSPKFLLSEPRLNPRPSKGGPKQLPNLYLTWVKFLNNIKLMYHRTPAETTNVYFKYNYTSGNTIKGEQYLIFKINNCTLIVSDYNIFDERYDRVEYFDIDMMMNTKMDYWDVIRNQYDSIELIYNLHGLIDRFGNMGRDIYNWLDRVYL
jgi:hypothetical protein